ncbi:MAG: hypothetical protein AB7P40_15015 [Chloroflexota bacterium]
MLRQLLTALLLLLLSAHASGITGARAIEIDPAASLPPGATARETVQGDVDGDGQDDLVTLYSLPGFNASAPARGGLMVLLARNNGARPIHLFGEPPRDLHGEPILDANGSSELTLQNIVDDGRLRIVLSVTNRFPNAAPRTLLWVFGWGEPSQPVAAPTSDIGPVPPPWEGTGFRIEAYLEGNQVEVAPSATGGSRILRRQLTERMIGGPDTPLALSETYTWRGDGYRLAERMLSLPPDGTETAGTPETAVLSFYAALARGDVQSASTLLSDALRGDPAATLTGSQGAPPQDIRVEEVRLVDAYQTRRDVTATERQVYVRVSMADPAVASDAADSQRQRRTLAGTWRAQKIGEQWQLGAPNLHETATTAAIAEQLPVATTIQATASGDLRASGREDVAVLAVPPGRYALVEPYIIFSSANGLQQGVPLASYVTDGLVGGPFGTIRMDDVNGDGSLEVTFSGIVGAHSALLWVLHWDGATLAPLFQGVSNSPAIGLEDLDADGVAEILMVQSGYCGSYASSPILAFAFRWEDGVYRSASWRYPTIDDGIDDRAEQMTEAQQSDPSEGAARACVEHMLATADVFRGRAADAAQAYLTYLELARQTPADSRAMLRPIYLGERYVEADLRAALAALDAGKLGSWTPAQRAVIHALLGDALSARAQHHEAEAEQAVRNGRADREQAARANASDAQQAASREYQEARDLLPDHGASWPPLGQ